MGNIYRDTSGRVTSIPSKYKTVVVISNSERKGFSSQTKRFPLQHCLTENLGPGSYNYTSTSEVNSPSFSTKGTTGFVPSNALKTHTQKHVPGPNAYNLQSSFINKYDFNTGVSRVFRQPVAVQLEGPKNRSPAPNEYNVHYGSGERFGSLTGSSFFVSKTKRETFNFTKDMPSPCHYYVEDDFQRVSKAVLSPFKSKTQRLTGPLDNHFPGPAAYSPHKATAPVPVRRTTHPKRSVLTISAPPLMVPKPPPTPGPGHYEVSRSISSKNTVPTAAFASKSDRITCKKRTDCPGPGFYDPHLATKQSFFYNDSRIWLPV